jgi:hypothetical protein
MNRPIRTHAIYPNGSACSWIATKLRFPFGADCPAVFDIYETSAGKSTMEIVGLSPCGTQPVHRHGCFRASTRRHIVIALIAAEQITLINDSNVGRSGSTYCKVRSA